MAEARAEFEFKPNAHMHPIALTTPFGAALIEGTQQYYSLCHTLLEAGRPHVRPRDRIIDLNCGSGQWCEPFVKEHEDICRFIALADDDESMDECLGRFRVRVGLGFMEVAQLDLDERFPEVRACLMLSVMGLSQITEERVPEVLSLAHKHLDRTGALLMVERIDQLGAWEGDPAVRMAIWERLAREAGFKKVEKIWRSGPFVAWKCLKN